MNQKLIDRITKAVLYEGYLLYPYRASAVKNQHRWTFGALYPPAYSKNQGGIEPIEMRTECLLNAKNDSVLNVRLRFLQLISRESSTRNWQEALDREVKLPGTRIKDLIGNPLTFHFGYPSQKNQTEEITRRQETIEGTVEVRANLLQEDLLKLTVIVKNDSDFAGSDRNEALMHSTVSTHIILDSENAEFVSLLDPPESLRAHVDGCRNIGNWPVLVGENGEKDSMLASPIILYDYPQVAPESAGDLFDSTEIDEILMLRILTLTEDEKREMREVDDRAKQLLEMTENLPPEQFMKLHGAIRGMKKTGPQEEIQPWDPFEEEKKPLPSTAQAFGKEVRKGDRVRLWPVKSADIMDLALNGRTAVIDSIEQDYEGRLHLAVVVEDDPGRDLGELRQPGHRFFFTPEEVEPL